MNVWKRNSNVKVEVVVCLWRLDATDVTIVPEEKMRLNVKRLATTDFYAHRTIAAFLRPENATVVQTALTMKMRSTANALKMSSNAKLEEDAF